MEENKLTDEQDNLLIEFDGYGFAPTITMPNAEEYAIEWKKRLIRVFDSKNAEIERVKEKFSISHYKDSWKNKFFKAQEELERLTEEKGKYQEKWQTSYMNELNLQKQVDELKKRLIDELEKFKVEAYQKLKKQAVKDTAKEILIPLVETEKQIDPLKTGIRWSVLKGFCKRYGVEVE
jgi:hypothetical protein